MLYHVLLLHENVQEFLSRRGYDWSLDHDRFEVAVEWSFPRDVWHVTDDPAIRREVIERGLGLSAGAGAGGRSAVRDFNLYYGAAPSASSQFIQSPATWRLPLLSDNIADDMEFERACRLKWAFRIKPDLVVTDGERAVCLEAKWEGGESWYPTTTAEHRVFTGRGRSRVSQTDLQRFLFSELLDLPTEFLYLVRKPGKKARAATMSWEEAFTGLNLEGTPPISPQLGGGAQSSLQLIDAVEGESTGRRARDGCVVKSASTLIASRTSGRWPANSGSTVG